MVRRLRRWTNIRRTKVKADSSSLLQGVVDMPERLASAGSKNVTLALNKIRQPYMASVLEQPLPLRYIS